jgi:hypothetical protein
MATEGIDRLLAGLSDRLLQAEQIGVRIGQAIARDVRVNPELPREWTGLDPQDGDQLLAAGFERGTPEWDAAEEMAEAAYLEAMATH